MQETKNKKVSCDASNRNIAEFAILEKISGLGGDTMNVEFDGLFECYEPFRFLSR